MLPAASQATPEQTRDHVITQRQSLRIGQKVLPPPNVTTSWPSGCVPRKPPHDAGSKPANSSEPTRDGRADKLSRGCCFWKASRVNSSLPTSSAFALRTGTSSARPNAGRHRLPALDWWQGEGTCRRRSHEYPSRCRIGWRRKRRRASDRLSRLPCSYCSASSRRWLLPVWLWGGASCLSLSGSRCLRLVQLPYAAGTGAGSASGS